MFDKGKNRSVELGAVFMECSAKDDLNIKHLFINVIQNVKITRDLHNLKIKSEIK